MADYDNRLVRGATTVADTMDTGLRAHMLRVYNYMVAGAGADRRGGLAQRQSPLSAQIFYNQVQTANGVVILQPNILGWIAMFAPLAMVFFLSFRICKMSLRRRPGDLLEPIAALMGVSLASILFVYTAPASR